MGSPENLFCKFIFALDFSRYQNIWEESDINAFMKAGHADFLRYISLFHNLEVTLTFKLFTGIFNDFTELPVLNESSTQVPL